MRLDELDYDLPPDRIAQAPVARGESRLLVVRGGQHGVAHARVTDLPRLLPAGALVVVNDTRVIKARLLGERASPKGPRPVELLLVRRLDRPPARGAEGEALPEPEKEQWLVMARPAGRLRTGTELRLGPPNASGLTGRVLGPAPGEDGRFRVVELRPPIESPGGVLGCVEQIGEVPLPPYIRRGPRDEDPEWYQTVYARSPGAVAAPTAGLHLTLPLLDALGAASIRVATVTLHVGPGTFVPVESARVEDHPMDLEAYDIPATTAAAVLAAKQAGAPVVAVGTTVVRALESAAADPPLRATSGETRLLIAPGYRFRVVDALMTNFHLPRTTLLALVYAFCGADRARAAYAEAIREGYRFYSYGDAMLVL